ncbi:MAG: FliM/FliN family flagellar motor switch protein [Acidimicrobiales bacterium]
MSDETPAAAPGAAPAPAPIPVPEPPGGAGAAGGALPAGSGETRVGMATDAEPANAAPEVPVTIELLHDVELKVEVVLGRARLPLRDLLALRPGSTIELDRSRNSPVDVLVNGTLFARGDIVVIDDAELGVQIDTVVGAEGTRQGRPA